MTTGIIFSCESELESMLGEIQMWTNTIKKFSGANGVDFYIVVDAGNIIPNWDDQELESYRVSNYADALTKLEEVHSECTVVKVEENESTGLKNYTHPSNACYVYGPDHEVHPTYTEDEGFKILPANLWAIECFVMTIYDRRL